MSYAVLRIAPVTRASLPEMQAHDAREYEPANAQPDRAGLNRALIGTGRALHDFERSRFAQMRTYRQTEKSPVGAEMILTASADWFSEKFPDWKSDPDSLQPWIDAQMRFLRTKYGDHCISAVLHLDEAAPHIHALIVPTHEYEFRNSAGAVTKIEMLSYGIEFSDTKTVLAKARKLRRPELTKLGRLQTEYAQAVEHLGLHRGLNKRYRPGPTQTPDHTRQADHNDELREILAAKKPAPIKLPKIEIPEKPGIFDIIKLARAADELRAAHEQLKRTTESTNKTVEKINHVLVSNSELRNKLREAEQRERIMSDENSALRAELDAVKKHNAALRLLDVQTVAHAFEVPRDDAQRIAGGLKKWNAVDFVMQYEQCDARTALRLLAEKFPDAAEQRDAVTASMIEKNTQSAIDFADRAYAESISQTPRPLTQSERTKLNTLERMMNALPHGTTFDVTLHNHTRPNKTRVALRNATLSDIERALPQLARENASGHSIIALPRHADHTFVLLDDTNAEKIAQAALQTGITPSLQIRTSANSVQALYVLPRMSKEAHNDLFTSINAAFGDANIRGAEHSFKLPSFAQRKPSRANADGTGPWVRLELARAWPGTDEPAQRLAAAYELKQQQKQAQPERDTAPKLRFNIRKKGATPMAKPETKARLEKIVREKYEHARETYGETADPSRVDVAVARWLAAQPECDGYTAYHLVRDNSPNLKERHPGSSAEKHVVRTLIAAGFDPAHYRIAQSKSFQINAPEPTKTPTRTTTDAPGLG